MRFGIRDDIIADIAAAISRHPQVRRAALFGWRGDYRVKSDIDLAVWADGGVSGDLYLDIEEAVGIYPFDVVDMWEVGDQALRERIEAEGVDLVLRGV